ncbi:MAG: helix-turn-helix domain-containing protein [Acholeplasmatales bacterium]|nr:helix-turn-helix domain-containing protein [Acholeplasmatales bacterium]
MNIEIANRLLELRKKSGLSQDELASKLGISRQSVSKWERAEASPDTDNLICLAKIYGVSLDELLSSDQTVDEIANEKKEETKDNNSTTVTLTDDEGQTVKIEGGHISFVNKDGSEEKFDKKQHIILSIIDIIILALTLTRYLVWSLVFNKWEVSWVLWVLMPAVMSIPEAIMKKQASKFVYPCFISALYLFLGMQFNLWHPYWFLFITIPFYYMITDMIEKLYIKDKDCCEKEKKD